MQKKYMFRIFSILLVLALAGTALFNANTPAKAAAVKVMPLGDSITGSPGCWRALLWNRLQSAGYTNIDFVGTQPAQGCGVPYDGDSEGRGGLLATGAADPANLPTWLAANVPDIVIMHLGTNDVWSTTRSTSVILTAFTSMVGQMRAANPNVKILVAQILPMNPTGCASCSQGAIDLNAAIPAWAAGLTTAQSPIGVVDQWTGFNTATDTGDGVHPNALGDQKMSDKWYPALSALLSPSGPTATVTRTPATQVITPTRTFTPGSAATRTRTPTTGPTATRTNTPSTPVFTNTPSPTLNTSPTRTATPAVDFSGTPLSGNAPLMVSFTHNLGSVLPPGMMVTCTWTFGDGQSQQFLDTCFNTNHTYTSLGVYTVSLQYNSAGGGSGTVTKSNYISVLNGPTSTPTPTGVVITSTRTITPTPGTGTCSPVTATITAPFTQDGAGTFCWQSTNLGAYINSWNTTSVILNGVNVTNLYVAAASYPAKINGYWYVSYNSAVAWGHFEAK